jgi:hypothetical protein
MSPEVLIYIAIGAPVLLGLCLVVYGWRDFYELGRQVFKDFFKQ